MRYIIFSKSINSLLIFRLGICILIALLVEFTE